MIWIKDKVIVQIDTSNHDCQIKREPNKFSPNARAKIQTLFKLESEGWVALAQIKI